MHAFWCYGWWLALTCVCQFHQAAGKLHRGYVRIGGTAESEQWQYLTKFGYAVGRGNYDFRFRVRQPASAEKHLRLDLQVFLDEEWDRVTTMPECRRGQHGPARNILPLPDLTTSGDWGPWQGGELYQNIRSHIWYFALSTCETGFNSRPYEVEYEFRTQQFDGSELSVELRYTRGPNLIALVAIIAIVFRFGKRCNEVLHCAGVLHPVIGILALSLLLQLSAQVLHCLHLYSSELDGIGAPRADDAAEVLFMLSQVVSSTLLVAIARGYAILRSKIHDMGFLWPIAGTTVLLHIVLVYIGRQQGEAADTYHQNEGIIGWALLSVRLLLFALFMSGIWDLRQRGGFRVHSFARSFQLAGFTYFLAYPVIFMLAKALAPYLRHTILQLGLLLMQGIAASWLSDLLLGRGAFFEVSVLSASLLPGSGGRLLPGVQAKQE